jgi:hypothetical protein
MISAGLTASNHAAALVAGQAEAETEFRAQAVRWDGKQIEVRQALVLTASRGL